MNRLTALGLAVLALLPVTGAQGATYTKQGYGGNLPSNAETTYGVGELDAITGALSYQTLGSERTTINQSVADLYAIDITGLMPFSATTVGTTGDPSNPLSDLYNSVLYLFDSTGKGVLDNDDDPNASFGSEARSTITSSALTPGLYYLGIGTYGDEPTSGGGLIFPDQTDPTVDSTQTYGPSGPGGTQSLSGWKLTSEDVEAGTYTIALTGANYAMIPEPPPLALLASGGFLLAACLRRRRRAVR